jgi:hypothetical protein
MGDKPNVQHTANMEKTDPIEVAGGRCLPPYRCKRCKHFARQVLADPENKGRSYEALGCDRPNRQAKITAAMWFEGEVERITDIPGREAEIRLEEPEKGKKVKGEVPRGPRYAVWVDEQPRKEGFSA